MNKLFSNFYFQKIIIKKKYSFKMGYLFNISAFLIFVIAFGIYSQLSLKVLLIGGSIVIFILILCFLHLIRYKFIHLTFKMISMILNRNFKIVNSLEEIKSVLQLTDKGIGLEELFSTPAWKPILSLESVNSPIWETLRDNFFIFKNALPPTEKLGEICKAEAEYLMNKKIKVDSSKISISTVKIFLTWIFAGESDDFLKENINEKILNKLYHASLEYRKEIACKGKGDYNRKQEAIDIVVNIIRKSKMKELLDWENPECFSAIMQPFIISPMINMSDIAVSIKIYKDMKFPDFSKFVDFCMFQQHPFVILERYDSITNTHYMIDYADLKLNLESNIGTILNFSLGPRACLGRLFAKEFLKEFFQPFMTNLELFYPENNHLFSGRDNDNFNLRESLHLFSVLLKIFYKLYFK